MSETVNPSGEIDLLIEKLNDWRGEMLSLVRQTILATDPEIIEEWKWMGSPVWSRHGILVVSNPHKDKVKLTFSHGASLPDPEGLFNNGFGGKVWRTIDLFEGDQINEAGLKTLIRAAIDYNLAKAKIKAAAKKPAKSAK